MPLPPIATNSPHSGGLSLGELSLSAGRFDLTGSQEATQGTAYAGLGLDLDPAGRHKLDGSVFFTRKEDQTVELNENGTIPGFDYGTLAQIDASGDEIRPQLFRSFATVGSWIAGSVRADRGEPASRGPLWFTNFSESRSFERKRDLLIVQVNGEHEVDQLAGLHLAWASNYARSTQDESALGVRYFFEPDDPFQPAPTTFPVPVEALGPGVYASRPGVVGSSNNIDEKQGFGRLDADYERSVSEEVIVEVSSGGWYEHATRNVDSNFLESPSVNPLRCSQSPNCTGANSQFAILGNTPQELGAAILGELNAGLGGEPSGTRFNTNASKREIWAWNVGGRTTFWDLVDLLGGIRLENIFIESLNDPFTGENRFGVPDTFPTRYLFWDRRDNRVHRVGNQNFPEVSVAPPVGTAFNDEILGLDVPADRSTTVCDPPGSSRGCVDLLSRSEIEALANGEINERRTLPSAGFAYRPLPGLALRSAWSQTVARPSFREMGFYVSVEPGTDDLVVGNPQLTLSEVESWDTRVEYTWGALGDLAALSGFYKTIQNPIESIVVRNPLNLDPTSSALFRTFFNNPNEATLWGIEAEARKNLGFTGLGFTEYLSIGGNFTWIEAEVDRTDAELLRSEPFFGVIPGDVEEYSSLEKSRRLFGQPKWIANADISFDQPEWGTKATLAFFAISDVLEAAGSASVGPDGRVLAFTIDRYTDSFLQLDLILSQTWRVELLRGDVTLKFSAKNLTDSTRRIIYDSSQTREEIPERSYKKGRDYKLTFTYTF
jgi:outer membrane receptor protein involved in Fe transport